MYLEILEILEDRVDPVLRWSQDRPQIREDLAALEDRIVHLTQARPGYQETQLQHTITGHI